MALQSVRDAEFKQIADELQKLFSKKNEDYGDDYFTGGYTKEERWLSVKRKVARLEAFYKNGKIEVLDETVEDTWRDLGVYCIMELMKRKMDAKKAKEEATQKSLIEPN